MGKNAYSMLTLSVTSSSICVSSCLIFRRTSCDTLTCSNLFERKILTKYLFNQWFTSRDYPYCCCCCCGSVVRVLIRLWNWKKMIILLLMMNNKSLPLGLKKLANKTAIWRFGIIIITKKHVTQHSYLNKLYILYLLDYLAES